MSWGVTVGERFDDFVAAFEQIASAVTRMAIALERIATAIEAEEQIG